MVKKIVILVLAIAFKINAQVNLVMNPSFEEYSICPSGLGEASRAINWDSFTGSSDYFNPCASQVSARVPLNEFGYQTAYQGNSYGGVITYYNASFYREVLGGKLQYPLSLSQKYYFSFMVCRGNDNGFGGYSTNKIGIKLTKTNSYTVNISNYSLTINNSANFSNGSIITDTLNWTRVKGSFISDSAYQYVMIGNFFDDVSTTITNQSAGIYAYYYIDNVCISTDSAFAHSFVASMNKYERMQGTIKIFPNPASDKLHLESLFDLEAKLENGLGNTILEFKIPKGKSAINISDVPNGYYFLRADKKTYTVLINH